MSDLDTEDIDETEGQLAERLCEEDFDTDLTEEERLRISDVILGNQRRLLQSPTHSDKADELAMIVRGRREAFSVERNQQNQLRYEHAVAKYMTHILRLSKHQADSVRLRPFFLSLYEESRRVEVFIMHNFKMRQHEYQNLLEKRRRKSVSQLEQPGAVPCRSQKPSHKRLKPFEFAEKERHFSLLRTSM